MLKVNHFDEKHHINGNVFKFCITWQQNNNDNNNKSLKLLTKLHYLHLDVVTPGIKRNDIWQMDSFFFYFAESEKQSIYTIPLIPMQGFNGLLL